MANYGTLHQAWVDGTSPLSTEKNLLERRDPLKQFRFWIFVSLRTYFTVDDTLVGLGGAAIRCMLRGAPN